MKKYPFLHPMLIYKSLSYFVDADKQDMPKMVAQVTWDDVKKEMRTQIENS